MKKDLSKFVEGVLIAGGISIILLAGHFKVQSDKIKELQEQVERISGYNAIGKTLEVMRGTNAEPQTRDMQNFLDYVKINYQLGSNEVISLDISMAENWNDVYVSVRNKNSQGGGIIPGTASRSKLDEYISRHK